MPIQGNDHVEIAIVPGVGWIGFQGSFGRERHDQFPKNAVSGLY